MAGGDAKALGVLNRYTSPVNVFKALLATRQKISSGDLLAAKPDGTPEQGGDDKLNEWRAQAGIPEKPEGYLETLPKGLVIGEDDQEQVDSYLSAMHGADAPPQFVHQGLAWYYDLQESQAADRLEKDRKGRLESEDALRAEWGPEYRANVNSILALLDSHGAEGLKDKFLQGRMADGRQLGDDQDTLRFLSSIARQINPHGTVVPAKGMTPLQTIQGEIKHLEAESADQHGAYWKGPDAEGKQARLRELYDMEDRHQPAA